MFQHTFSISFTLKKKKKQLKKFFSKSFSKSSTFLHIFDCPNVNNINSILISIKWTRSNNNKIIHIWIHIVRKLAKNKCIHFIQILIVSQRAETQRFFICYLLSRTFYPFFFLSNNFITIWFVNAGTIRTLNV